MWAIPSASFSHKTSLLRQKAPCSSYKIQDLSKLDKENSVPSCYLPSRNLSSQFSKAWYEILRQNSSQTLTRGVVRTKSGGRSCLLCLKLQLNSALLMGAHFQPTTETTQAFHTTNMSVRCSQALSYSFHAPDKSSPLWLFPRPHDMWPPPLFTLWKSQRILGVSFTFVGVYEGPPEPGWSWHVTCDDSFVPGPWTSVVQNSTGRKRF